MHRERPTTSSGIFTEIDGTKARRNLLPIADIVQGAASAVLVGTMVIVEYKDFRLRQGLRKGILNKEVIEENSNRLKRGATTLSTLSDYYAHSQD